MRTRQLEAAVLALAQAVRLLVSVVKFSSSLGAEQECRENLPRIVGLLRDAEALLVGEVAERARAN
jgi:hypothetical protein